MKILTVVGARPQFVKAAVVSRAFADLKLQGVDVIEEIVHTGQHYDHNMSASFFNDLNIPAPAVNLDINNGPHGQMTGRMLEKLESEMIQRCPDRVLVYGDTNSTLAGALSAAKLNIPLVHVEAGLRSFNRKMPEEVNRVITDQLSNTLFTPTLASVENLKAEGIYHGVHNVGDVMFDSFQYCKSFISNDEENNILETYNTRNTPFALVTFHRAENTDSQSQLENIVRALNGISEHINLIFPQHPRTNKLIEQYDELKLSSKIQTNSPASYRDMIVLLQHTSLVITDSGGLQKEAFFSRRPCLTLRNETEWQETLVNRCNRLVDVEKDDLVTMALESMDKGFESQDTPYGEGDAGRQVANIITNL